MKLTGEEIVVIIIGFIVAAKLLGGKAQQQTIIQNALRGTTPVSVDPTDPVGAGYLPTADSSYVWTGF